MNYGSKLVLNPLILLFSTYCDLMFSFTTWCPIIYSSNGWYSRKGIILSLQFFHNNCFCIAPSFFIVPVLPHCFCYVLELLLHSSLLISPLFWFLYCSLLPICSCAVLSSLFVVGLFSPPSLFLCCSLFPHCSCTVPLPSLLM